MPTNLNAPDVLLVEAFLPDPDTLLQNILCETVWDTRLQARQTATFGVPYNYSGITYPETPLPPHLNAVCARLQTVIGFVPNNCLANYYPTGDSTMGFHSDSTEELEVGTGVAIVSLGAVRVLRFRKIDDKSVTTDYPLPSGSLLYMPPDVQALWKHGIPAQPGTEARISLTFRKLHSTS